MARADQAGVTEAAIFPKQGTDPTLVELNAPWRADTLRSGPPGAAKIIPNAAWARLIACGQVRSKDGVCCPARARPWQLHLIQWGALREVIQPTTIDSVAATSGGRPCPYSP